MEFHIYKDVYDDMFHICAVFHQMISLDDTILQWECDIFHA